MQSQKYYLIGLVLHFAKIKQKLIVTKFNLDIFIKIQKKKWTSNIIYYCFHYISIVRPNVKKFCEKNK